MSSIPFSKNTRRKNVPNCITNKKFNNFPTSLTTNSFAQKAQANYPCHPAQGGVDTVTHQGAARK